MRYGIFLFFALLFWTMQETVAQCTDCKDIYVWDFVTEDGERDKYTARMSRQFFSVLSQRKECVIVRRNPISKTFPEAGMIDALYFEDLRAGLQDTLQNVLKAKVVVFGILISEGGSSKALSLNFQHIDPSGEESFFVSHEMYLTTDEIEDPKRSEELIIDALNQVICQEITDPDFANLTKEETSNQLQLIGNQLSKLIDTPREKRDNEYYANVKKISEDFQKCFNRFSQLQPSVKDVEKFNVVKTEFTKQINNIGHDYLFSKLFEEEFKYDDLSASYKLGKLDINKLIENREYCIELCQKLIEHDLTKNDRNKQSKLETIKLNCYHDLLYLYNQQGKKETEIGGIRKQIESLTPDLEKVLARNEPIEVITNRVIKLHIRFRTGTANFTPESYEDMNRLTQIAKKYESLKVELAGHTDNIGETEVLHNLSKERAEAVKKYLVGKQIDENRITTIGYGGDLPIANNGDEETRKMNRRVEVTFKQ